MKKVFVFITIGILVLMITGAVFANSVSANLINQTSENSITLKGLEISQLNNSGRSILRIRASSKGDSLNVISQRSRELLDFGFKGERNNSEFLETGTGVKGSSENGYVMMRKGSITGISTNLEVVKKGYSNIEVLIYKNGKEVGFRNLINPQVGIDRDYSLQSEGIVNFNAGDVISTYLVNKDNIIKNVNTLIEITTN